jgi:hypothetical protein
MAVTGTGPNSPTDNKVQMIRSWTGLMVVVGGDAAIAVAAILGLAKTSGSASAVTAIVSILTSAFTAIGTMTTAYFGIRAMSNTAQSSIEAQPGAGNGQPQTGGGGGRQTGGGAQT